MRPIPTILVPALVAALAAGCVISNDSRSSVSGHYISAQTLASIEPGKSSDYVLAVLGDPSTKTSCADGTEIWKWSYTEHKDNDTAVILLLASQSKTTSEHTTYVELKDGAVVKAWRD